MCHEGWVPSGDGGDPPAVAVDLKVDDGVVPGHLYEAPDATLRAPAVLLTDIYGTVPFYHEVSRQLAANGYPTLLIDLFSREGPLPEVTRDAAFARRGRMDEVRGIADASAALDHVKDRYATDRAVAIGFCLGGLFAFDLAIDRDDLVTISYYGFPEGVPVPARVSAPRPIDRADEMTGPILAFWGSEDHNIPVEQMERFGEAMAEHDVDYEAHIHEGVGHGFLQGMVEDRDDSEVALQSWYRTLAFLAEQFGE